MYFTPKVKLDGYTFDSEAEAEYYKLLLERQRKKEITLLSVHPIYPLQESFVNACGLKEKPINYEADFSFYDLALKIVRVVDVKGYLGQDNAFPLHRKLFDFKYLEKGLCLEVLRYSKKTGFVPWEDYKKLKRLTVSNLKKERSEAIKKAERIRYVVSEVARLEAKTGKTAQEKGKLTRLSKEKEGMLK